jgi:hypothetical protein
VYLTGRTAAWAKKVGAAKIELSMTHSRELAAAVAVALEEGGVGSTEPQSAEAAAWTAPERTL